MKTDLLPSGLSFVERTEPLSITINKADPEGPSFSVQLKRLSREQFTDLVSRHRPPANVDPTSKTAKTYDAKFQDAFCRKVILGWSGLTVANLADLLPNLEVNIDADSDDAEAYRTGRKTIEYNHDLAVTLYRSTWGDRFGEPLFKAIKDGVGEESDRDDALKND